MFFCFLPRFHRIQLDRFIFPHFQFSFLFFLRCFLSLYVCVCVKGKYFIDVDFSPFILCVYTVFEVNFSRCVGRFSFAVYVYLCVDVGISMLEWIRQIVQKKKIFSSLLDFYISFDFFFWFVLVSCSMIGFFFV